MAEKMDGITILFIKKCLVAIEDCWKEKKICSKRKLRHCFQLLSPHNEKILCYEQQWPPKRPNIHPF